MTAWACCGLTDPGGSPDGNDDWMVLDPGSGVFIVADGMGGRPGGAQASRIAAGALAGALERLAPHARLESSHLRAALAAANEAVRVAAAADPALTGMGTTLTAAILGAGCARILHVGDSRLYRFAAGRLEQLTRDHTLAAELLQRGDLSPEGARRSRFRHVLSRSLGTRETVEPDVLDLALGAGDWILILTDGVCRALPDDQLAALVGGAAGAGARAVCQAVLDGALAAGPDDNLTVVAIGPHG